MFRSIDLLIEIEKIQVSYPVSKAHLIKILTQLPMLLPFIYLLIILINYTAHCLKTSIY
jgi:hypothetical protein